MNQGKMGNSKYLSYQIFFLGKLMNSILLQSDKMNSTIGLGFPICDNITTNSFNNILTKFLIKKKYIIPNEKFNAIFESLNQRRRYILTRVFNNYKHKSIEKGLISLLNVPTGFGKTYSGLYFGSSVLSPRSNLKSSNFLQINPRIIYTLPFLSIIEQVESVIREFLQKANKDDRRLNSTSFLVHHHLTEPIFNIENNYEYDDSTAELFVKSWNSQYILSTFNQLLNSIFKSDKNSSIRFSKILNATWILDEVQSIPLKYWKILEDFFLILTNLFSINLLLMSATIPKIINQEELGQEHQMFYDKNVEINEIISVGEYKDLISGINRINIEFYGRIDFNSFLQEISDIIHFCCKKSKNLLIVCNTRNSAQTVFEYVKDLKLHLDGVGKSAINSIQIKFLAATLTPKKKSRVLEKVKALIDGNIKDVSGKRDASPIILISTQCIEAGVDIDFDIVIRDFAPLDNIIQVAGRCNRNNRDDLSNGIVKVYRIKDSESNNSKDFCDYIYDPHLLRLTEDLFHQTRQTDELPYIYEEKDIYKLVNKHYENVDAFFKDGRMQEIKLKYQNNVLKFEYLTLSNDFNLIPNMNSYSIYIEEDSDASEIIKKYKSLIISLKNERVNDCFPLEIYNELLRIKKAIQNYMISAYLNKEELTKLKNVDKFGDLYIVPKEKLNQYYSDEVGFFIK
jgi:CRISPR-associated endonuclease/helicase Cas3